mmetsp:Transcript_71603/g.138341  ORF Transcript_71603/g.138341 Transcript_71603/m.138341 type:complete len:128 (+) Transcript_71603:288-671(+)
MAAQSLCSRRARAPCNWWQRCPGVPSQTLLCACGAPKKVGSAGRQSSTQRAAQVLKKGRSHGSFPMGAGPIGPGRPSLWRHFQLEAFRYRRHPFKFHGGNGAEQSTCCPACPQAASPVVEVFVTAGA